MLAKFPREDEAVSGLDFVDHDVGLLGVSSEF
jgi:hypothetical protein